MNGRACSAVVREDANGQAHSRPFRLSGDPLPTPEAACSVSTTRACCSCRESQGKNGQTEAADRQRPLGDGEGALRMPPQPGERVG
jgi:hypothetical protein